MRIAIDGYNLAIATGTGVATYGFQLGSALRRMGHSLEGVFGFRVGADAAMREVNFYDQLHRAVDPKKRIPRWTRRREFAASLFDATAQEVPITDAVEKGSFRQKLPPFDRLYSSTNLFDRAFTHFAVRKRFLRLKVPNPPEVVHWTYPVPIVAEGSRNVYTLHDLVPLRLPYATLDDKRNYDAIVKQCVRSAAHICTVSEASREDIVERYGIAADRITNTYQSAPAHASGGATTGEDAAFVSGVFGLEHGGYFLYFGAIEPKKNVGRIIEAFLSLQTETPLVIVGGTGWQSDQELLLMPGGPSGGVGTFVGHQGQKIVRLGYLPRDVLNRLIRSARAVLFPSLYEGFGLPVLEAMQVGTPVITSTTSSLPEVAGDAARLVDPYDVAALIDAMRGLDSDAMLRERMRTQGLEQAAVFTEERYMDRLGAMYDRVMSGRVA